MHPSALLHQQFTFPTTIRKVTPGRRLPSVIHTLRFPPSHRVFPVTNKMRHSWTKVVCALLSWTVSRWPSLLFYLCAGAEPGQQSTCFPATACTRVRRSGATCEESLQSTLAAVAKDICAGSTQSKQAGSIIPSHVNLCDKCPKMSDEGRLPHTLPPMALLCRGAGMGLGVV